MRRMYYGTFQKTLLVNGVFSFFADEISVRPSKNYQNLWIGKIWLPTPSSMTLFELFYAFYN